MQTTMTNQEEELDLVSVLRQMLYPPQLQYNRGLGNSNDAVISYLILDDILIMIMSV